MNDSFKPKLVLMTLGGSPEPLKKSIEMYEPDQIFFLASHESVSLASDIFKALDFKPEAKYEITEDPNLMFECYKKARRCVDRDKKTGISPKDIMVDYTGGTKVMTAALGNAYRFNYVGGSSRNKDGVGTVLNGKEELFVEMSPWSIFAEEERRQVVTLFNRRKFISVCEIINTACERELPFQIEKYFQSIRPLAQGLQLWDQFEHKSAQTLLKEGFVKLRDYLSVYPEENLRVFSKEVERCLLFLNQVMNKTKGLCLYHRVLIDDLLNHARRKIEDCRYDDATARIYRALELYGQILFEKAAKCDNGEVDPKIIPESIRDEFVRKYQDSCTEKLKLPLQTTFECLKEMGNNEGMRFFSRLKKIKDVQSNRNQSILAHGIKPIPEHAARSIFQTVSEFVCFTESVDYPKLP